MKKGVLISTTEHLLSALVGVGVDNAIVELDNLELPILDGSAQPFVEMIEEAGLRRQRRRASICGFASPLNSPTAENSSQSIPQRAIRLRTRSTSRTRHWPRNLCRRAF